MQLPPPVLALFGTLGWGEILFILLLVVLLFGVNKIPQLARSLGRAQREFQKARQDVEEEMMRPPPAPAILSEEERVRRAAQDLGIPVEGRSVDEIKMAISERMRTA